ncbi:hypothetical protein [Sphingomonas sp.]|uniref:hypothetical protein n=1 Tax=Sphingomonas sp. TaxID=28214 RepID=UPI003B00BDD9
MHAIAAMVLVRTLLASARPRSEVAGPPSLRIALVLLGLAALAALAAPVSVFVIYYQDDEQARITAEQITGGHDAMGKLAIDRFVCTSCHQIGRGWGVEGMVGPPLTTFTCLAMRPAGVIAGRQVAVAWVCVGCASVKRATSAMTRGVSGEAGAACNLTSSRNRPPRSCPPHLRVVRRAHTRRARRRPCIKGQAGCGWLRNSRGRSAWRRLRDK